MLTSLASKNAAPPFIITSIPGIMQKITSYKEFSDSCHSIKTGQSIDPLELLRRWERMGYQNETMVEVPGTMSRRGGIVDVFPPTSDLPVRLDFLGNTIENIRYFDPVSQRSLSKIDSFTVCPASELLTPFLENQLDIPGLIRQIGLETCTAEFCRQFEEEIELLSQKGITRNHSFYAPIFNRDSILNYLPPESLLIFDEPEMLRASADSFSREAEKLRAQRTDAGELPSNYPIPYFAWEELVPIFTQKRLEMAEFGPPDKRRVDLGFSASANYAGRLPAFIATIKDLLRQKKRVVLTSYQASRLEELLNSSDVSVATISTIDDLPPEGSLSLVQGSLARGWTLQNQTYLFTDEEIFSFVKQRRFSRKRPVARHILYPRFKPGDYVVHIEHGIAKFSGVAMMGAEGLQKEYMVLQYAAGDRLYVPADQIDRISRYIGASEHSPVLNRLGTQDWSQTKKRVKESVENIARDLLTLYAAREVVHGFSFSSDNLWQKEFESSFPYVETPDQLEALAEVKQDMEQAKPMDRIVCGDVGYGKTEIAIRAAFKAVMDGKQVAVLVPTTILAQQHYNTFTQRMEAFPVKIDMLSRFCTPKQQKETLAGLESGTIDICIGTHRLIQKDVAFKNWGLLVIDEEQRFGVGHKEYIKKMKQDIHVLTLSATPIPRTLHMALSGVRDMSTMETAPENRLPIRTYVAEYEERLVREAILKELERNGQVFFVHNRVQSIYQIADRLRILVPEARVSVGHGQMPEHELEKVMTDFIQGETDVLVCSTIIESGLDMPRVNTLIVNRADKFGLTQLYQLRGRIGRGTNLAYAYFLYDKGTQITTLAQKRLQTIYEATELGAGFGIAMKDLEIRGAGSILGFRQSGFISAVGFDLYSNLLRDAVENLKAKKEPPAVRKAPQPNLPAPVIDLALPSFIPEDYITDIDTRLSFYESMVKAHEMNHIERIANDLIDRFGPFPSEVQNLLYAVKIKILAARVFIESVAFEEGQTGCAPLSGNIFREETSPAFS